MSLDIYQITGLITLALLALTGLGLTVWLKDQGISFMVGLVIGTAFLGLADMKSLEVRTAEFTATCLEKGGMIIDRGSYIRCTGVLDREMVERDDDGKEGEWL